MTQVGAQNFENLINLGFDIISMTPAPQTSAKISLKCLKEFGNVNKGTEKALYSGVPRLAMDFGISTIFWGENDATQVGDKNVLGVSEFDGNNLRKMNTLMEGGDGWLVEAFGRAKSYSYIYPDEIEFEKSKLNIFFLGPVWDDWSNTTNATFGSLNGLHLRPFEEEYTGDISNASMLDEEFTNINMMIKYYKFGFGRATDIVNEMIRNGEISREKGIELVVQYDGVCSDEIINRYCRFVDISERYFWEIVRKFVNLDLFELNIDGGRPVRKFEIR
jgi:hypothetical protein